MILSLSAYAGPQLAVANAAGLVPQAILYNRMPLQISYSVRYLSFYSTTP